MDADKAKKIAKRAAQNSARAAAMSASMTIINMFFTVEKPDPIASIFGAEPKIAPRQRY